MAEQKPNTFFEMIQTHEREWGKDAYQDRPTLEQIMSAKVVAFWQRTNTKDKRLFITLHEDTKPLEAELTKLVIRTSIQQPDKRFALGFQNQKRLKIQGLRIMFTTVE